MNTRTLINIFVLAFEKHLALSFEKSGQPGPDPKLLMLTRREWNPQQEKVRQLDRLDKTDPNSTPCRTLSRSNVSLKNVM